MKDCYNITFNQIVHDMLFISFTTLFTLSQMFFFFNLIGTTSYLSIFDWSEVAACLNNLES